MNTSLNNLTAKDLRHAADLRDQIDAAQAELETILGGQPAKRKPGRKSKAKGAVAKPKAKSTKKRAKSKISDAGRARIAAAQKKRWAAKRKADKAAAKAAK